MTKVEKNLSKFGRVLGVVGAATLLVAWAAGCRSSEDGASTRTADAKGGNGLPCDVEQLLTARCATCHTANPTSAPMPLVTWDDLMAPAKSDPKTKVAELALSRIRAIKNPMPPSNPLAEDEISIFENWVRAGAPKTSCVADGIAARDANVPACVLASDCPGNLICRAGVCDVECATDKDCAPSWTCEETRCKPPSVAADGGAATAWGDFGSSNSWAAFNLTPVVTGSYSGSTFDGRYVYFAPDGTNGTALRYDTKGSFSTLKSWSMFDLTTQDANAKSYRGAIYDGRYVYFVPASGTARMARFDTLAMYLDPAAWTIFDLTTIGGPVGFTGGAFDGRYIYLVPASSASGTTFRYDTQGPFTSLASWSTFGIASVDAAAYAFIGAVFDGRYLYYVPSGKGASPHGVMARFDTEAQFTNAGSWTILDLATLDPKAVGYRTGAFDGRYLYLVPGWTAPSPAWATSTVARYDTKAAFPTKASWTFFDSTKVAASAGGFNAAVFDGRRMIFTPGYVNGAYHGTSTAFDVTGAFDQTSSWSTFDTTTLGGSIKNLRGGTFDGRYTYFAPSSGIAVRFDARTPSVPASVPAMGGSFY
jgi:hypothetical protein